MSKVSTNCGLMVHICEVIISPGIFFIFWKLWFLGLLIKGQKVVQNDKKLCLSGSTRKSKMTKNSVHCTPDLRKHTSYDCDFRYTCVKWWHLQILSSFFQSFDFSLLLGGKRAKNGWKRQILYALLCISGTILYMIMVFNTLVQNQDISSNCFSYFQNSDFFGFQWKGYHNDQDFW